MFKRILLWGVAVIGLGVLALVAAGFVLYTEARTSTVGELRFLNELAVPPLLEPSEVAGARSSTSSCRFGQAELLPDKMADTWGANGAYLEPTLRAERGDRVELRVRNELPQATTIHWHGMHLPAQADGGPHQLIPPGTTWAPTWTVVQPAATLWYHPHPHGQTADHVYRGSPGSSFSTTELPSGSRFRAGTASTTSRS